MINNYNKPSVLAERASPFPTGSIVILNKRSEMKNLILRFLDKLGMTILCGTSKPVPYKQDRNLQGEGFKKVI